MQVEALQLTVNSKGAQADLGALSRALDQAGAAFTRMETKFASGGAKTDAALGRALTQAEKTARVAAMLGKIKVDGSSTQSLLGFAHAVDALGRARMISDAKVKTLRDFARIIPNMRAPSGAARMGEFLNAIGNAKTPSATSVRNLTAFLRVLSSYKGSAATRSTGQLTAFMTAMASVRAPSQSTITRLHTFLGTLASAKPIPNAQKIANDLLYVAQAAHRASTAFAALPRSMHAVGAPALAQAARVRAVAQPGIGANAMGVALRGVGVQANAASAGVKNLHGHLGILNERFRMGYQLGTIFSAMFSSFTIGQFVKGIYESGIQVLKLQKALLYTTGTFSGAQKATGEYMAMAQNLGLSIDKSIESFGRFMISSTAAGVSAGTAKRTFEGVSMALQVVGASTEQTQYAFYGLTEMLQKGEVMSKELNRQLGQQIPGSAVAAAAALSHLEGHAVSVAQMFKQVASGKVQSSVFAPAYAEELRKMYEPLMELAAKRPDVALNRLHNAYKTFLIEIGNQGFMKGLTGGFSGLADQMVTTKNGILELTPHFKELAAKIGGNLATAVRTALDFFKMLAAHIPQVIQVAKVLIEVKLAMTMVEWAENAGKAAAMFGKLAGAARGAAAASAAVQAVQTGGALASAANPAISTLTGGATTSGIIAARVNAGLGAATVMGGPGLGVRRAVGSSSRAVFGLRGATLAGEEVQTLTVAKDVGMLGKASKIAAAGAGVLMTPFKGIFGLFGKLGPTLAGAARGLFTLAKGFGPVALIATAAVFALTKFLGATTEIEGKKAKVSGIVGAGFSMIGEGIANWWKSTANPITMFGLKMDGLGKSSGDAVATIMAAFVWLADALGNVMKSIGDMIAAPFKHLAAGVKMLEGHNLKGAAKEFASAALDLTPVGMAVEGGNALYKNFQNQPSIADIKKQIEDRATAQYAAQNAGASANANEALDKASEQQIMAALAQQKAAERQLQAAQDLNDATANFKKAVKPITWEDITTEIANLNSGRYYADFKNSQARPDLMTGNGTSAAAQAAGEGDAKPLASVQRAMDAATQQLTASTAAIAAANRDINIRHPEMAVKHVMETAREKIGQNETGERGALMSFFQQGAGLHVDPEKTAWCAAFVNAVLGSNGIKGTGQLNAKSFLNYGQATNKPQEGDIVVFNRGGDPNKGHVGFYEGDAGNGRIKVLGGNQGNQVKEETFSASQVASYRHWAGASNVSMLPAGTAAQYAAGAQKSPSAMAMTPPPGGSAYAGGEGDPEAPGDVMGNGADVTTENSLTTKRVAAQAKLAGLLGGANPYAQALGKQAQDLAGLKAVITEEEKLAEVAGPEFKSMFDAKVLEQIAAFRKRSNQELADAADPMAKANRLTEEANQIGALRAQGMADEASYQEKINALVEEGYERTSVDNDAQHQAFILGQARARQIESEIELRKTLNDVAGKAYERTHTGALDRAVYAGVTAAALPNESHAAALARLQTENGGAGMRNIVQGATANVAEDSAAAMKVMQDSLTELQDTYRLNPTAKSLRDDYKQALKDISGSSATTLAGLEADATAAQRAMAQGFADAKAKMENENGFQRWADQLEPFAKRMNDIKANFVDTLSSGITDALSGDKVDWRAMAHNLAKQVLQAQVNTGLQGIIQKVTGGPATPEQAQMTAAAQQTTAAQTMGQAAQSHITAATSLNTAGQALLQVAQMGTQLGGAGGLGAGLAANDNIALSNNAGAFSSAGLSTALPDLASTLAGSGGTHNWNALAGAAAASTHDWGALAAASGGNTNLLGYPDLSAGLTPTNPIIPLTNAMAGFGSADLSSALPSDILATALPGGFKAAGAGGGGLMGSMGSMAGAAIPALLAWLTRPKAPPQPIVNPLNGVIGQSSTNTVDGIQVAAHANLVGSLLSTAAGMAGASGFGAPGGNLTSFFKGGGSMGQALGNFGNSLPFGQQMGSAASGMGSFLSSLFGGFSEGGYSNAPVHRLMRSVSFHDAPRFREGTANTSNEIPAILHPNEAVVPLSRGRAIPIEGDMGSTTHVTVSSPINIYTPDANSFRQSQSSLQSKQNMTIRRAAMRNLSAAA